VFIVNGKVYAVNGNAKIRYRDTFEIWRDNPKIPGTKINIGEMIQMGLKLCR